MFIVYVMESVDSDKILNLFDMIKVGKYKGQDNPHKYILILAIVELLEENNNHQNYFYFEELEDIFIGLYEKYYPNSPDYRKMLEHPFYYLQNDGFWFLKIKDSKEKEFAVYSKLRFTKKRLIETVEYGYLERELFRMLKIHENRKKIISIIEGKIKNDNLGLPREVHNSFEVKESIGIYKHEVMAIESIRNLIEKFGIGFLCNNSSVALSYKS